MSDRSPRLEGRDWQDWGAQLLNRRYSLGDYQAVPDKKGGDAGIEGFSLDGCVYQMYGPEGELSFADRHQKMRRKITDDVKKFIDNRQKFQQLLGQLKIKRWVLLVPAYDSRELVEHCTKKTNEVLAANLPYVDDTDFRVIILGEESFSLERNALLAGGISTVRIEAERITDEVVDEWIEIDENLDLVRVLDEKIARLPTLRTDHNRKLFRRKYVSYLLHGQNVLEELRSYPQMWSTIRRIRSERENYLITACLSSDSAPGQILKDTLEGFKAEVRENAPTLASETIEAIAHEAVAYWLMRCPLDFPN